VRCAPERQLTEVPWTLPALRRGAPAVGESSSNTGADPDPKTDS
jgi:hypothetical protein